MGRLGLSRTVALENTPEHLRMVIHSHPRLSNSAISAFTPSPNSSQRSVNYAGGRLAGNQTRVNTGI